MINIPGVDTKKGLDFCNGDLDIYLDILREYVSDMYSLLEKIQNVSEESLKDYAVAIHSIKSINDAIGAEEARKTAKNLEETAKKNDLAGVLAVNNTFKNYAKNLTDGVKTWLENQKASP